MVNKDTAAQGNEAAVDLTSALELAVAHELEHPPVALTRKQRKQIASGISQYELRVSHIDSAIGRIKSQYYEMPLGKAIEKVMAITDFDSYFILKKFKGQLAVLQTALQEVSAAQLNADITGSAVTPESVHNSLMPDSPGNQLSLYDVQRILQIPHQALTLETAVQKLFEKPTQDQPQTLFGIYDDLQLVKRSLGNLDDKVIVLNGQKDSLKKPTWEGLPYRLVSTNTPSDVWVTLGARVDNGYRPLLETERSEPRGPLPMPSLKGVLHAFGIGRQGAGALRDGTVTYHAHISGIGAANAQKAGGTSSPEEMRQAEAAMVARYACNLQRTGMAVQVVKDIFQTGGTPPSLIVNGIEIKSNMLSGPFVDCYLRLPLLHDAAAMASAVKLQLGRLTAIIPVVVEAVAYAARPATAQPRQAARLEIPQP